MSSETLSAYVDQLARRERAARHAVSTPLLVHTLALGLVLALDVLFLVRLARTTETEWSGGGWDVVAHDPRTLLPLLPLIVYLVLWTVSAVRRRLTGIGPGRDGWGVMALVSAALLATFPWGLLAVTFLGAAFFLGLGLLVLGTRLREPSLWVTGLVLMAVSPFAALGTFENHAGFLGPWPTQTVLALLLVGLAVMTARARQRERRVLAGAPAPAP